MQKIIMGIEVELCVHPKIPENCFDQLKLKVERKIKDSITKSTCPHSAISLDHFSDDHILSPTIVNMNLKVKKIN
jgi:hypothetical protein